MAGTELANLVKGGRDLLGIRVGEEKHSLVHNPR